jgi:hypothetical protein
VIIIVIIYIYMCIKKAFYACEFVFVCSVSRYLLLDIDTSSLHVKGFSINMGSTVQKEPRISPKGGQMWPLNMH